MLPLIAFVAVGTYLYTKEARADDAGCTEGPCGGDIEPYIGGFVVLCLVVLYLMFLSSEGRRKD
jgi:hypothetical protein